MDEATLVAAAQAGDEGAFMQLVRQHHGRVRGFARQLVGDHQLAEDVAQESFLRAWQGLAGYRCSGKFSSWLYTITRRTAADHLRRRTARTVPLEEVPALADHQGPDPDLRSDLEAALSSLATDQREAFLLVVLFGLSYKEAAAVVDCAVGTIASRVCRARTRLAALLALDGETAR